MWPITAITTHKTIMATGKFTENDLQHGALMPLFTDSTLAGGLGWIGGLDSEVDRSRWVVRKDLIDFLKDGNVHNAKAYAEAMKTKKHKNDVAFYDDFCKEVLDPLLRSEYNSAYILQKPSIVYAGQTFTLYNPAPTAGDSKLQSAAFERNYYRVIPEVTFLGQYPKTKGTLNRRPDLVMFVNGLYFSYCEVKATQRGQSSAKEGRAKIARDVVDATVLALAEGRTAYVQKTGGWPGWGTKLPVAERDIIEQGAYPFLRAVHLSTVDMHEFWVLNDLEWLPGDIEACFRMNNKLSLSVAERDRLVNEVTGRFQKAPPQPGMTPFENVQKQLRTWFDCKWGIDADVSLFNYTSKKRTTIAEPMRVRAAQRMMLVAGLKRIVELYKTENIPKIHGPSIALALQHDLPMLGASETQEILNAATSYQNGKDAFSMVLQGAAGLGKTNVMVWMARALTGFIDAKSSANLELFQSVVILTDRKELRTNMADEAARMKANKAVFKEAKTFEQLVDCLTNTPVTVVNIQKFPGMLRHLDDPKNKTLKDQLGARRVAFIIDEIHRSQSGEYHDTAMEIFDSIAQLNMHTPGQVVRTKRNMIIGFTATPRDELLARFGEWRAPKSPGDRIQWIPYYSYSVDQAVKDGIVLDVKQNIVPFASVIEYDAIATERKNNGEKTVNVSDENFYQNPERIAFISKHIAKIFASTTIYSGRKPNGKGFTMFGDGKAMVVAYSIKAAIEYHAQIQAAIAALIQDPQYADRKDILSKTPVLIVYTDTDQDSAHKCRALNGGRSEEQVLAEFRRKDYEIKNAIIIVVDKLLTGFDEPSLHTLFVDKGLNDVLLLQAFYRVGRIEKYKTNCLIVDFSRDNVVSSRVNAVFAKYGGMTVSQFDAMPIEERMNEAYRRITEKEIKALFQAWKTMRSPGTDAGITLAAATLQAALAGVVQTAPKQALAWQQALATWLGTTITLKCILDFTQPSRSKHWNMDLRNFAREALNELSRNLDIQNPVMEPEFEITSVDLVHADDVGLSQPKLPEKPSSDGNSTDYPTVGGTEHEQDILEFISALQNESNQHQTNIERVKHGLSVLFTAIDAIGKTNNNDIVVKKIHQRAAGTLDEPYEDRIREFHRLFNKACMRKEVRDLASTKAWGNLWALESKLLDDYETWVLSK